MTSSVPEDEGAVQAGAHGRAHRDICDERLLQRQPLVSVLMLTYNHAPYIAQAIEGVMAQDGDVPFELIIGEDASTDGACQGSCRPIHAAAMRLC